MLAPDGLFKDASALAHVCTGLSAIPCILRSSCVLLLLLTHLAPDLILDPASDLLQFLTPALFLTLVLLMISIPRCMPIDDPRYSCDHTHVCDSGFPFYLSA